MERPVRIARFWTVLAATTAVAGCGTPLSETQVCIARDYEAVLVRFHNRSGVELVVKPYVRQQSESFSVGGSFRMSPTEDGGPDKDKPDLELAIFKYLPVKSEEVGAYSIEVGSPDSDARLAVIDVTRQEMAVAKEAGRLTYVFRPDAITVVIGTTTKTVPWLRPPSVGVEKSKS